MTTHRPLTDIRGRDVQAHPGLEVDLQPEQALRLIQSGQAEAVQVAAEAAVAPPVEAAVTTTTPATGRTTKRS
jgi:hypothetical protein